MKNRLGYNQGENHPLWGKHHTEETKTKIRIGNLGKKHSRKTKQKLSIALEKWWQTEGGKKRKQVLIKQNKENVGWKHTKETKEKIARGNRNKIVSEETRKKISLARKGKPILPGVGFQKGQIPAWIREKATKNLPRKEKHWNWQGGIAKERDLIKISPEYKQWIKSVFKRDDYTCQRCLKRGSGNLNAHHIIPFSVAPEERFEISNGATLCEPCHYFIHSKELVVNQHV